MKTSPRTSKTSPVHCALGRIGLGRRQARRLALAQAWLLVAGIGAGAAPAAAQTPPGLPADQRPPITEDMLRRVGPPPRPSADLRIEVNPGTPAADGRKARQSKTKNGERRP